MSAEVHKVGSVLDASSSKEEQQVILSILDESNGLNVYLVGVSKEVREVMAITGFEHFFKYFDTVEECQTQIG